jgi:hypothetical protein
VKTEVIEEKTEVVEVKEVSEETLGVMNSIMRISMKFVLRVVSHLKLL